MFFLEKLLESVASQQDSNRTGLRLSLEQVLAECSAVASSQQSKHLTKVCFRFMGSTLS